MNTDKIKPPIGLRPKNIADLDRLEEVAAAIHRYREALRPLPIEWVEEYNALSESVHGHAGEPAPPAQDFPPLGFACETDKGEFLRYASADQTFVSSKTYVGLIGERYDHWQPANFPGWEKMAPIVKALVYWRDGEITITDAPDERARNTDVIYVYRRPEARA